MFYDLTDVHILSRVIKSFPWAELHFEYNISTESRQTLLQPAQTLCIVWAGCLYVPVEGESRTGPFVETLDSNTGFTMCKHFIIPGKHRLIWDDKTTFEDTIHCWVKGERATETSSFTSFDLFLNFMTCLYCFGSVSLVLTTFSSQNHKPNPSKTTDEATNKLLSLWLTLTNTLLIMLADLAFISWWRLNQS